MLLVVVFISTILSLRNGNKIAKSLDLFHATRRRRKSDSRKKALTRWDSSLMDKSGHSLLFLRVLR